MITNEKKVTAIHSNYQSCHDGLSSQNAPQNDASLKLGGAKPGKPEP